DVLRALATEQALCDTLLGLEKTAPGKACAGYAIKRCKGACLGHEAVTKHSMRLVGALARLKLVSWPFNGPALIREGDEAHLVNAWRYLGTAKNDEEIYALLENNPPGFDHDTYKILAKYVGKMMPLPGQVESFR
ncbi:MAG: ethanolamine utilization protein, partial [Azonexus sp.]|nr:ethanolamine utilization protein [Azonexus sp.]